MSRFAVVLHVERVSDDGHGLDVVCDPGGGANLTAPHCANPGDDSSPLPGDFAQLGESSGTGAESAVGYCDTRNAGKAKPGEKRIYARNASGSVVVDLYLKGDGSLVIDNGSGKVELQSSGAVVINGVVISKLGAITAPLEVTAMAKTVPIALSTHVHLGAAPGTPVGPPISPPPVP
jgi:hypothetical protein